MVKDKGKVSWAFKLGSGSDDKALHIALQEPGT